MGEQREPFVGGAREATQHRRQPASSSTATLKAAGGGRIGGREFMPVTSGITVRPKYDRSGSRSCSSPTPSWWRACARHILVRQCMMAREERNEFGVEQRSIRAPCGRDYSENRKQRWFFDSPGPQLTEGALAPLLAASGNYRADSDCLQFAAFRAARITCRCLLIATSPTTDQRMIATGGITYLCENSRPELLRIPRSMTETSCHSN